MVMASSVSFIFETGYTYSCSYNKGEFVELEEKMLPINLKGISKVLEISGFGIDKYSVRSESGHMITLRYQACYVPGVPKDWLISYPQGISTSEGCRGIFIAHFHYEYDSYVELNLKEDKSG